MPRAFLVVMDSVGIGGAPEADQFFNGDVPDTGANTLGHIIKACADGLAEEGRSGPLRIPNLMQLGMGQALALAVGDDVPSSETSGAWGAATEVSRGKDTPSGHWELAGLPVPWDWHYFPDTRPAFPKELSALVAKAAGTDGILGNCHASGTQIIEELGQRHLETGWPICYTSADSVFQIAAHEESFGLDRLLSLCEAIAPRLHEMKVGRVIARPFIGSEGKFERTSHRKDFAIPLPAPVLTDWVQRAGGHVYAVGKIGDIFSMQGIDEVVKGSDAELMKRLGHLIDTAVDSSLTFANFVEFDSLYGHRRDVSGYARHLEWFDAQIGPMINALRHDDVMLITADHGNDPTWIGTDHTRERVPVLVAGTAPQKLGLIGFKDVAALIAAHLMVDANPSS
ncbi:Phosphopentomutase [Sulfitobacter noctilucicola]|uniref:Phosphopentomutase n=1 Tax=Sulfitobacter noctilucicola TaxID=1342301 RepID=A0A7W6M6U6_9RHOB|nr:phosphopentomutase [Sulfitobacter noctilucicola]KIN61970.1 Phosphopentomutase [Sulfitobacter noctilucicola]MBB4173509.1 phosphopentomutase [Sulfitobacter noctilucicola]